METSQIDHEDFMRQIFGAYEDIIAADDHSALAPGPST